MCNTSKQYQTYNKWRYYKSIQISEYIFSQQFLFFKWIGSQNILNSYSSPEIWWRKNLCRILGVLIFSLITLGHFTLCITLHSRQVACVSFRSLYLPEKAISGHICHLISKINYWNADSNSLCRVNYCNLIQ